jgi:hypothetical protein
MPSALSSAAITSPVTVPFCRLPGSLGQTFEPLSCLLTAFQVGYVAGIAARPDFAYFVVLADTRESFIARPDWSGAFALMWYATNGECHLARVGMNGLLEADRVISSGAPTVLPVNHPVYRTRMPAGWEPEEEAAKDEFWSDLSRREAMNERTGSAPA